MLSVWEERLYGEHTNVHQSHSQNDSGDLRGVAGGDGELGCLCGKAGTSHLCDGSAHSFGCVVNGYYYTNTSDLRLQISTPVHSTFLASSTGLFLTYANKRIETQNFLISDIGQSDENALICSVSIGKSISDNFDWNHQLAHEPKTEIPSQNDNISFFGWYSSLAEIRSPYVRIKLMRKADIQGLEGIFSCNYRDRSTVSVGIYYPSKKFHCVIVRVILLPLSCICKCPLIKFRVCQQE